MAQNMIEGEKKVFVTGNEVVAWAAIAAGADIMYGYPITPQNEIMHYWTRLAPRAGKKFLQTEDELSAGFTTIGGVLAGRRAFTATAGPGNTLMQEPVSMAEMMRLPMVIIIQQRGGPSTATVIYSQQELNLTCYGGNGEGLRIVYSTSSHQDLFDYTIKAFNTAWKYRFPTFVLGDGYQAKMREGLTIYDLKARGIELVPTEPILGQPGTPGVDRPPSHIRNTYNTEEELYEVIMSTAKNYETIAPEIIEYDEQNIEDAEIILVAHGVVSRAAYGAMLQLREQGYKVGYFRPITLRPFPTQQLYARAKQAQKLLVVESALGQLARTVRDAIYGCTTPVETLLKPGMGVISEELVERVVQIYAGGAVNDD
ncbi:ferredoxin oxidoreductase [Desulfotruncus arcticus]|uniref:ferredoxin oxidoreductase n=1 Tax=Desulfotruncus arcticus TaxID=341036 RepID=UPI000B81C80B|nr:ferredoxin oxidoreductase [Desulfotruncus arcticus]